MHRKKASDFPQELLDLFDRYVHGRCRVALNSENLAVPAGVLHLMMRT